MVLSQLFEPWKLSNPHSKSEKLSNPMILLAKGFPLPVLTLENHSKKSMHLRKTGNLRNSYHRYTFQC